MANVKISELPIASTLDGTELFEAVQGGANAQSTVNEVATYTSNLLGWAEYRDTQYTESTKLTVPNGGAQTKVPNNAGFKIETHLPSGVTELYDSVGGVITPVASGDSYMIRVRFKAQPSAVNAHMTMTIDIGGAIGEIDSRVLTFPKGTSAHQFSTSSLVYSLDTFVANGAEVYLSPSDNVDIWDISFVISRVTAAH